MDKNTKKHFIQFVLRSERDSRRRGQRRGNFRGRVYRRGYIPNNIHPMTDPHQHVPPNAEPLSRQPLTQNSINSLPLNIAPFAPYLHPYLQPQLYPQLYLQPHFHQQLLQPYPQPAQPYQQPLQSFPQQFQPYPEFLPPYPHPVQPYHQTEPLNQQQQQQNSLLQVASPQAAPESAALNSSLTPLIQNIELGSEDVEVSDTAIV